MQNESALLFFFKGNGAAIWRVFPYVVVKALVTDFVAKRAYVDGPMLAVLGTTAAVLVTHPLDTVKNRLTAQSWNSYYHGTFWLPLLLGALSVILTVLPGIFRNLACSLANLSRRGRGWTLGRMVSCRSRCSSIRGTRCVYSTYDSSYFYSA